MPEPHSSPLKDRTCLTSVEWAISRTPVDYRAAEALMEARVAAIAAGDAPELAWLLEHPPLYTAGTSAKAADLLDTGRFPTYRTGRGGQYTYHGPGQRVVYIMLNLKRRSPDVRAFVRDLERWLINSLAAFNIKALCHEGRVGVWVPVNSGAGEEKIAAIGIRLRKWVSFHGISLNINPDLSHFGGIVPCGLPDYGVTSFDKLGQLVTMPEVDIVLRREFEKVFGPTVSVAEPDVAAA